MGIVIFTIWILGGIIMLFGYINLAIMLSIYGLGIYTLILLIKALKIYIKKNS